MSRRRFMDVVNWDALVAPGVILCKDGSYLAGWRVAGIDTESLAPENVQVLRGHIASGLSHLGDAHTLWTVWQRRPRPPGNLVAETGQTALDILADETNALFSAPGDLWQDRLSLFLGWTPEGGTSLAQDLAGLEDARGLVESWLDPILALTRIDPAQNDARQTGPAQDGDETGPDQDGADQNGPHQNSPVFTPEMPGLLAGLLGEDRPAPRLTARTLPVGLDALLSPALFQSSAGGAVRIGDRPAAVMTLSGEREAYMPSALDALQDLDLPLIWITRYQAMSKQSALARAEWKRKTWSQAGANMLSNIEGSGAGRRSLFADRMAAQMEETRARIESSVTGHGGYLCILLLHGAPGAAPGALTRDIKRIRETVQLKGFALKEERTGAVPVLLAALPGHAAPTARQVMVEAQVTADLMPVRGLWPGAPACPSPLLPPGTPALLPALMRSRELFHFNLHVGDVGHTLIFGPTGTGKSVLLGQLAAAWLRYGDAQVIVFDRGRSIRHACAALGGVFLEPGAGDGRGIAPLAQTGRLGEAWALNWLTDLVRQTLKAEPGPDQMEDLRNIVDRFLGDGSGGLAQMLHMAQHPRLRQAFDTWVTGPLKDIFDRQDTDIAGGLASSPLTVFETGPLLDADPAITRLSLDYIFAEVAHRFDGRPTLVVIDEAWKVLGQDIFAARIKSWLKEGRKSNVAVVLATQSVPDAANSGVITDLLDSCPTRLYLANPAAATQQNSADYRKVGLGAHEIATVANLRLKQELLMVQDGVNRVLCFPLSPVGLSLLGRTGKKDSDRAAKRAAQDPEFWMEDLAHEEIIRTELR